MNQQKTMISIQNVKKQYKLGQINSGTLQQDLVSLFARLRGKEDPNTKIGQIQQLEGNSFMALNGIDLEIYQGEAIGIIGTNGAGKSTLLKILSRITAPSEGDIDIYGRISSILEIGTGFNGLLTGRENIYLNGAILGMSKAEIDAKMDSIIAFSEIGDFIDTPVKRYSSGMFVKLAFSVAAHLDSEILIMDEILAVGDMAFQAKCIEKMNQIVKEENRTILYVSHNMNTIRDLCNRCVVLQQGKIIFNGDVDEAIAIYMNQSVEDNEVNMDLRLKQHTSNRKDTSLNMTQLELVDKKIPTYDNKEALKILLDFEAEKLFDNIFLRMSLRDEKDIPIGTVYSKPFTLDTIGKHTYSFDFPLDLLTKGTYYISIGIYRSDEIGNMIALDHITRAFKITIEPTIKIHNFSRRAHGYIQFYPIESKKIK